MGSIRVDLLELVKFLRKNNATQEQVRTVMFEFERRIAKWGKQFPNTTLHERSKLTLETGTYDGTAMSAITSERAVLKYADSYLILGNVPDEAIERFYQEAFPELGGEYPALLGKGED